MSPLPPGAHPSPEEVDALLDLPGQGARQDVGERSIATHVAGCARCQAVASSLREVRELLRQEGRRTPAPPPDLGSRLDVALARASAERDGTVVPLASRRSDAEPPGSRGVPRWVAVAAGVAVLGGSALAATQVMNGSDTTSMSAESSGGGSADQGLAAAAAPVSSGTDYVRADLSSQVGALLDDQGLQPLASTADDDAAPQEPLSSAEAAQGGDSRADAVTPDPDEPLTDPAGLQGCLEAIGADGVVPLAVDLATFEGEDAAVIVLPGAAPEQVEVWVVARDCRPGADGLKEYQVVTTR